MMTGKQYDDVLDALGDAMNLAALVSAASHQADNTDLGAGIRSGCTAIVSKLGPAFDTLLNAARNT